MTDLLPCPFCGSEIKHVERWTRSFVPPRLHHEWHHVADNKEICPVRRGIGKIVATATDEMQDDVICRWNNRVPGLAQAPLDLLDSALQELRSIYRTEHERLGAMQADKSTDNVSRNWQGGRVNGLGDARMILQKIRERASTVSSTDRAAPPSVALDALPSSEVLRSRLPTYVSNAAREIAGEAMQDVNDEVYASHAVYALARWFDAITRPQPGGANDKS